MNREQANDLKSHPLWTELGKELDMMIESTRCKLETEQTPIGIARLQESLKMLRRFKRLPVDIYDREEPNC